MISDDQVAGCELAHGFEGPRDTVVAEFVAKGGDGDAFIESKTEKPCLFVLAVGREPGGFGRF